MTTRRAILTPDATSRSTDPVALRPMPGRGAVRTTTVRSNEPLRRTVELTARPPVLDDSDDPTGAAIVWPVLMLMLYVGIGLGILLVR